MCGRYASTRVRQDLIDAFDVERDDGEEFAPDYNVAPTKPVPVILTRDVRELHVARWGLVPHWAADSSIGARLINARLETADRKPAFRRAFARQRCLLPADGYFEWYATEAGDKQPFFIRPTDGGVLAMAGLYEARRAPDDPDRWLLTCTVLTTEAADDVRRIHDRMPLIVEPDRFAAWLDPAITRTEDIRSLLAPVPAGRLEAFPVSTAVNRVANNGPELVKPLPEMGTSIEESLTLF